MPPLGFEPTIAADELPQTYALDRAVTNILIPKILLALRPIYSYFWCFHFSQLKHAVNSLDEKINKHVIRVSDVILQIFYFSSRDSKAFRTAKGGYEMRNEESRYLPWTTFCVLYIYITSYLLITINTNTYYFFQTSYTATCFEHKI